MVEIGSCHPILQSPLFLLFFPSSTLSGRDSCLLHFVLIDTVQGGKIQKYLPRFLLVSTSSITMSIGGRELTDREYILLCVLNTFFALIAILLNCVTIHAIKNTSLASLPKNLRVLLLNLAISDLSVGLVVQPFCIVCSGNWTHFLG